MTKRVSSNHQYSSLVFSEGKARKALNMNRSSAKKTKKQKKKKEIIITKGFLEKEEAVLNIKQVPSMNTN